MLRYKTETRPGLVALYDIRPGNGVGQFLQPRSPHGAPVAGQCQTNTVWYVMLQLDIFNIAGQQADDDSVGNVSGISGTAHH